MKNVLEKLNCPSLRAFLQFGLGVPYSTLKNYFSEKRLIPKKVFEDMCKLANLNTDDFNVKYLDKNWGQVKGGKVKGRFKYMKTFN